MNRLVFGSIPGPVLTTKTYHVIAAFTLHGRNTAAWTELHSIFHLGLLLLHFLAARAFMVGRYFALEAVRLIAAECCCLRKSLQHG